MPDPKFVPAWVSSSGRVSWRLGPVCATAREAADFARAKLAVVSRLKDGRHEPMAGYVEPKSLRRAVWHWLDIVEASAKEDGP